MSGGDDPSRRRWLFAGLAALVVLGAIWLPRWWEMRLYRQAEALTGVGAKIQAGTLTDARRRVDPGRTEPQVVAALGRPSLSAATEGSSSHAIWTYYYGDGTLTQAERESAKAERKDRRDNWKEHHEGDDAQP